MAEQRQQVLGRSGAQAEKLDKSTVGDTAARFYGESGIPVRISPTASIPACHMAASAASTACARCSAEKRSRTCDIASGVPKESILEKAHNMELYFEEDDFDGFIAKLGQRNDIQYIGDGVKEACLLYTSNPHCMTDRKTVWE